MQIFLQIWQHKFLQRLLQEMPISSKNSPGIHKFLHKLNQALLHLFFLKFHHEILQKLSQGFFLSEITLEDELFWNCCKNSYSDCFQNFFWVSYGSFRDFIKIFFFQKFLYRNRPEIPPGISLGKPIDSRQQLFQ